MEARFSIRSKLTISSFRTSQYFFLIIFMIESLMINSVGTYCLYQFVKKQCSENMKGWGGWVGQGAAPSPEELWYQADNLTEGDWADLLLIKMASLLFINNTERFGLNYGMHTFCDTQDLLDEIVG